MVSAVEIEHLYKDFTLDHTYSIKDSFVNLFRKNKNQKRKFRALDDINLMVEQGESIGLVGLNGSGKSTLLKCISGVQMPDMGSLRVRGSIAGLIEVGAGFHPDLTGEENVFLNGAILGMSKKKIEDNYDDIVKFSEVEDFMQTNVRYYSSGMFLRLAFSVAVYSDPDVFLVDEILSVGDAPFRKKCMKRIHELKEDGRTLIIVSHSQSDIKEVTKRCVWLHKGKVMQSGETVSVLDAMNAYTKN
ncbi:MAG: ABC transporter ATP-binding protein [Bifidobacteriaceae bacterium]|jgi:ABC-2 type transport system ATP-binding protein|nr:ABC transporter ATP-binding protein [Bifidobacteriaceae bacterium]